MILDLLSSYQMIEQDGNLALDNYRLKEGLYIRLAPNGEIHAFKVDKNQDVASDEYFWFRNRDFRSILVDMNKPVDSKKQIHSNNIYSIFFKSPRPEEKSNFIKKTIEDVNRYYSALSDQKEEKLLITYDLPSLSLEQLEAWKQRVTDFLPRLLEVIDEIGLKAATYVKIFADVSEENYETEYLRYIIPKIYNSNSFNIDVDGVIFGLSNSNMGLNAKKPFLEHKTTNYKVPFRITSGQALNIYYMFKWLENQYDADGYSITSGYLQNADHDEYTLTRGIKNSADAHLLHIEKGKYAVIDEYDFVPSYQSNLNFHLHNYLGIEKFDSAKITQLSDLEQKVDELLFKGQMRINYFTKDTIKPKEWFNQDQIELLLWARDAFYNYFKKGDITSFRRIFDRISAKMIKLMAGNNIRQPASALNLRLSMLEYLKIEGRENMGKTLNAIRDKLTNDLLDKEIETIECLDDSTYYFIAGQIASFLISKSKAQKITYRLGFDLLNARSVGKFRIMINTLFVKYGYDIEINSKGRFNKLFYAYNSYTPDNNVEVHSDAFLAGLSSPCIIYTKAENLKEEVTNEME